VINQLSFPELVVEYSQSYLGIPHHGFPEPLLSRVLKGTTSPWPRPAWMARRFRTTLTRLLRSSKPSSEIKPATWARYLPRRD